MRVGDEERADVEDVGRVQGQQVHALAARRPGVGGTLAFLRLRTVQPGRLSARGAARVEGVNDLELDLGRRALLGAAFGLCVERVGGDDDARPMHRSEPPPPESAQQVLRCRPHQNCCSPGSRSYHLGFRVTSRSGPKPGPRSRIPAEIALPYGPGSGRGRLSQALSPPRPCRSCAQTAATSATAMSQCELPTRGISTREVCARKLVRIRDSSSRNCSSSGSLILPCEMRARRFWKAFVCVSVDQDSIVGETPCLRSFSITVPPRYWSETTRAWKR